MRMRSTIMIALAVAGAAPAQVPTPAARIVALERLAAAGDGEAAYHVGMAYHLGSGVPADPARALAAFRRAADAGDPLGAYKLGCFYDGQGGGVVTTDPALALRWKLVAAEAGYALAQSDVAAHYAREGRMAEAVTWLERSAAQGWPGAIGALVAIHGGAGGGAKDPVRAAAYARLLADQAGGEAGPRAWADKLEAALTPTQRDAVRAIVAANRPAPTALTLKARTGARAADALLAKAR